MATLLSKSCSRCKSTKPIFDFSDHPKQTLGKQSQCKSCFAERGRLRRIGKPCISCGNPKEVGVPKGAKICIKCSETCFECKKNPRMKQHRTCKECQSVRAKERNSVPERKEQQRISRISSLYKISKEKAKELSKVTQCDVCQKVFTSPRDRHIDHCHASGQVRGVLCFNCNASLGHVNDDQARLAKLIGYLSKFKNGADDIRKVIHYCELLLELEYLSK